MSLLAFLVAIFMIWGRGMTTVELTIFRVRKESHSLCRKLHNSKSDPSIRNSNPVLLSVDELACSSCGYFNELGEGNDDC